MLLGLTEGTPKHDTTQQGTTRGAGKQNPGKQGDAGRGVLIASLLVLASARPAHAQLPPAPPPAQPAPAPAPQQPPFQPQPVPPAPAGQPPPPPGQPGYPVQGGYPPPGQGYGQPGYGQQYPPPAYTPPAPPSKRGRFELGTLYGMSVAYGVGMGVWVSTELDLDDPGLFLIAPAVLGIAAPVGVYALDHPAMGHGVPAATAAGMFLGAAEGFGIWSMQYVNTSKKNDWGFTELTRSTAIGSSAGAVGGYLLGYYFEPEPEVSLYVSSGGLWGTVVGSMLGYGITPGRKNFREANDTISVAGFIGLNVGAAGAFGTSLLFDPSARQIGFMWAGAGIGAAVSLPVFLLYAGEGGPPARRGFLFMATTTTLGIVAGGILGTRGGLFGTGPAPNRFAMGDALELTIDYVAPFAVEGGAGLMLGGRLF